MSETATVKRPCEGCGKEMGLIEFQRWSVCLDCTKARQRAVVARKCCCGFKRRPTEVKSNGMGRTWISCFRCLGQIKQLS